MFKKFRVAAVAAALLTTASAFAQYAKGPDPTASALERAGTFATRTVDVSSLAASGFGGGRIWYPTTSGKYGVVAVSPGFTGTASTMYFWGERLSSHGFVVIVIETNTLYDQPGSRATQLMAALNHVVTQGNRSTSPLYGKVAFLNSILHFDGYLLAGAGVVRTETSSLPDRGLNPAADLGLGMRFVAKDYLAVNVALINTSYVDQPLGSSKGAIQNMMTLNAGISLFLPFSESVRDAE